jgi:suppressor for copper-sensitivity B
VARAVSPMRLGPPVMRRSPPFLALAVASALGVAALGAGASAQGFAVKKARVEVAPELTAVAPGEVARVAVWMEIEKGWHTNSHHPTFEYLIPTALEIEAPPDWSVEGVDYPPGELATFSFEEQPLSVYQGRVGILARLAVAEDATPGDVTVDFALTYQACDDRSCLPPVTERAPLVMTVGAGGLPIGAPLPTATPAAPAASGLAWILLLGVVGGLILNAMPCVLPVLSLKVLGLVKSAGQSRRAVTLGALATSAGILLSFWALAAAAIAAKSAGSAVGWGVQFQEPTFVAALAVVVLLFTLNLWGLFEIPLPARLANAAAGGPSEGLAGHLASGLFATLMATPCSAPFLGTAVGFGLAQPPLTILAVFTAIAVGMSLPYLALALFPGAARLLPRPGPWMATLKTVMGFLLAAAAVWLFYVLSAQMAAERVAFIELALLAMAACIWMRHRAARTVTGRRLATLGTLAAIAATLFLAARAEPLTASLEAGESAGLIAWTPFDRAEAEALRDEGRLVFVDVTADWCFTCKVNERLVLETPAVADAFAEHSVIAMKADWTNRSDDIAAFLADHGRYGIPFYMLYRPGAEPVVFSELLTQETVLEALLDAAP